MQRHISPASNHTGKAEVRAKRACLQRARGDLFFFGCFLFFLVIPQIFIMALSAPLLLRVKVASGPQGFEHLSIFYFFFFPGVIFIMVL